MWVVRVCRQAPEDFPIHTDTIVESDLEIARNDDGNLVAAIVRHRFWLPGIVYECLPYFYIATGLLALASSIYVSHWSWAVPHYALFAGLCIHAGLIVGRARRVARRRKGEAAILARIAHHAGGSGIDREPGNLSD